MDDVRTSVAPSGSACATGDSMILIDQDGKLLAVSGCAAESLGRHPADLVGTNIRSIVPEPFASHHLAQVGQVLRSGQPLRMDDDRDGQCIRSCLYPLLGLDGASDCVLLHKCGAAARSPRRESPGSDPALRDGAWRHAGTEPHEMVTRHFAEPEARWLYVSPAAQQSYGHVPEALIGRTPLDFYHPDESNRIRSALDAVLAGRSATVNARFRRSDGSYAWIETSFEPVVAGLTTGRPLEIIGVSRDITARVQAEQALRFGGSGLAAVVETFGAGIWEWDLRSDHVYLSPRQKALIGFGDDFPNSAMAWWERVWPEDLPRLQRSFQAVRDGETDTYEAEYRIRHRDGNYRWIHSAGHAVRDGREAGVYMTGIDLDITARKTMEDELQAARAEAAQASQAKARLLAAAGHDMRQPVHALGFFLAALNRRCQDNPEAVKVVLNMEDCLGALQRMLNSLLDLTRLEAGILKPEIVAFPIDPLFEKLRTEFAGLARRRRLDLRVVPSGAVVQMSQYCGFGTTLIAARMPASSHICCIAVAERRWWPGFCWIVSSTSMPSGWPASASSARAASTSRCHAGSSAYSGWIGETWWCSAGVA